MLAKKKEIKTQEAVFSIKKGKHCEYILIFLQNNMSSVSQALIEGARKNHLDLATIREDDISRSIPPLLNEKLRDVNSDYMFTFEAKCGPDILIYVLPYKAFSEEVFVIEAKRLPPTSSREYVKGDRGGIERFKKEKHGKKHDIAAMLGYVQGNDFNYWHTKVNSWIDDLRNDSSQNPGWENQDKLTAVNVADIAEYTSKHSRKTKEPITLHHFWINLRN